MIKENINFEETLEIDLSGLEIEDIEVFLQEGSQGMPEFAASSGVLCCVANCCSCKQAE